MASSTTSDDEIARNRHPPFGLRAAPVACLAVAPRRCSGIACVAPTRMHLGDAGNQARPTCTEVPWWLAPYDPSPERYHHNRTGEDNGDAHHKRQIMGREVVVAITEGRLDFGPWEQIFYGEFDGRRNKRVLVKIIGE